MQPRLQPHATPERLQPYAIRAATPCRGKQAARSDILPAPRREEHAVTIGAGMAYALWGKGRWKMNHNATVQRYRAGASGTHARPRQRGGDAHRRASVPAAAGGALRCHLPLLPTLLGVARGTAARSDRRATRRAARRVARRAKLLAKLRARFRAARPVERHAAL